MNAYDFDKTIYDGDSTIDFWKFCMIRYPRCRRYILHAVLYYLTFHLKLCSREKFKREFYQFVREIPDVTASVKEFWNGHITHIGQWYRDVSKDTDLIISASPDFLILPICKRLNVRGIASEVNPLTGELLGSNCRGEEKVKRFNEVYPNETIDDFYSDSLSDLPLASIAHHAYLVKNQKICSWPR